MGYHNHHFPCHQAFSYCEGGLYRQPTDQELALLPKFSSTRAPRVLDGTGINGKNLFHAAMGFVLPHLSEIFSNRKATNRTVQTTPKDYKKPSDLLTQNRSLQLSYFPIIFPFGNFLLKKGWNPLRQMNCIQRYFMPSLNTLDYTSGACPILRKSSKKVLCLPACTIT